MSDHDSAPRFRARPRTDGADDAGARLLDEVGRLRSRFERSARDGRDDFIASGSDSYDIGMLALIHLADLVGRELPDDIAAALPTISRDGLRATRNIAAHNYAGLDNSRLWQTVTVHAPTLLDAIEAELRRPLK